MNWLKQFAISLLLVSAIVPSYATVEAAARPTKGVKKICPDGSLVPLKKECPDGETPPPDPVLPGLSVSSVSGSESGGYLTFRIIVTGTPTTTITVDYATNGSSAVAGVDYTETSGTLSIPTSVSSMIVNVPILSDTTDESDESFNFVISNATNATINYASVTGTIIDDDDPVTPPATPSALSIADVSVNESAGTVTLTVTRASNNSSLTAGFSYATSAGTATAGSDYTTTSGSGSLTAGVTSTTFTVPILSDTIDESNETFTVTLTAGSNATLSDGSATVTILDDDENTPLPDPNPTPEVGDELAESLEGYTWRTVTDHDYMQSLTASWGTGAIPPSAAPDHVGAYRQICGANTIAYNDHILYTGIPGRSHLHDFNGNKGVNASSTFDTLLASGESSCNDQPGTGRAVQRSSYWMPALLNGNGQVIRYDLAALYYKRRPKTDPKCAHPSNTAVKAEGICTEIPNGIKMIAGSSMVAGQYNHGATAPKGDFYCTIGHTGAGNGVYTTLAAFKAGSPSCTEMWMRVHFPTCWNGTHLWKTDKTHVVYPSYGSWGYLRCPTTHPYLITEVSVFYIYTLTASDIPGLELASDYMNPNQPEGWSLHSDAHIVWDARVKRMLHDNCIDKLLTCSGGDLGNGLQLKGAAQPRYGWKNPNRLQTMPPMPDNMVMP